MTKRFVDGWMAVKGLYLLAGVTVLLAAPRPASALGFSVFAEVTDCAGSHNDGGPGESSATVSSNACGNSASAEGHLSTDSFGLDLTSVFDPSGPNGVSGRVYLEDTLTFYGVPFGGSADVTVNISGGWGGDFDFTTNASFQVGFDLLFGTLSASNPFSIGNAYANLVYTIDNSLLLPVSASGVFSGDCGGPGSDCPNAGTIGGTYSFSRTWTIFNFVDDENEGQPFDLFAQIEAQANNGATAFINHPLIITVNDPNVSFTSASGLRYTAGSQEEPTPVPEPATLFLLGSGLAVVARRRAKGRAAADRAR